MKEWTNKKTGVFSFGFQFQPFSKMSVTDVRAPNLESYESVPQALICVSGGSSASGVENKRRFRTKPAISGCQQQGRYAKRVTIGKWWNYRPFPVHLTHKTPSLQRFDWSTSKLETNSSEVAEYPYAGWGLTPSQKTWNSHVLYVSSRDKEVKITWMSFSCWTYGTKIVGNNGTTMNHDLLRTVCFANLIIMLSIFPRPMRNKPWWRTWATWAAWSAIRNWYRYR